MITNKQWKLYKEKFRELSEINRLVEYNGVFNPFAVKSSKDRYNSYRYGAKKRQLSFDLSLYQFTTVTKMQCAYCGTRTRIGIDRIDSKLGYTVENIVPCCSGCNRMKGTLTIYQFIRLVRQIYRFQKDLRWKWVKEKVGTRLTSNLE